MKHIITGGNGFLGSKLAETLAALGEQVLVVDSDPWRDWSQSSVEFREMDIREPGALSSIDFGPDDVVYHMAAKLLMPILPRAERQQYFWSALYEATETLLNHLETNTECRRIIYFTTDMVYGHTLQNPRTEDHPRAPLGPYGEAKYQTELLCERFRERDFKITLFRPRLIIGPGRVGILGKLFGLIDHHLPVPMIGSGKNYYQFISVQDCVDISLAAVEHGCPNSVFNVGSLNPPTVKELLSELRSEAGSKSVLVPTPAPLVKAALASLDKIGKPLMDPEQYLIADETCVLDMSRSKQDLGWQPKFSDVDMLNAAYNSWKNSQ